MEELIVIVKVAPFYVSFFCIKHIKYFAIKIFVRNHYFRYLLVALRSLEVDINGIVLQKN